MYNRYRRKRPKVDASIFDSALSHTRSSDTSGKREKIFASTFGQIRRWTSFESSPVSVKILNIRIFLTLTPWKPRLANPEDELTLSILKIISRFEFFVTP